MTNNNFFGNNDVSRKISETASITPVKKQDEYVFYGSLKLRGLLSKDEFRLLNAINNQLQSEQHPNNKQVEQLIKKLEKEIDSKQWKLDHIALRKGLIYCAGTLYYTTLVGLSNSAAVYLTILAFTATLAAGGPLGLAVTAGILIGLSVIAAFCLNAPTLVKPLQMLLEKLGNIVKEKSKLPKEIKNMEGLIDKLERFKEPQHLSEERTSSSVSEETVSKSAKTSIFSNLKFDQIFHSPSHRNSAPDSQQKMIELVPPSGETGQACDNDEVSLRYVV